MSKKLKFKIGEQYGKYEFELDWLKSVVDNNLRCEVYNILGKDKITIFGYSVKKILLAYNCDFLSGAFYFIENGNFSKSHFDKQMEFSNTRRRKINIVKLDKRIWMMYMLRKKNK